jgi:hypothetical protein
MPYLAVRDIDIFFDRAGAGAPLLAISGSRGDLRRKPNLLESPLAKSFDVLAYDQRGLGRTSKPNKACSIADYAALSRQISIGDFWRRILPSALTIHEQKQRVLPRPGAPDRSIEFSLTMPASKSEDASEVQLSSRPGAHPIQSGAPSRHEGTSRDALRPWPSGAPLPRTLSLARTRVALHGQRNRRCIDDAFRSLFTSCS